MNEQASNPNEVIANYAQGPGQLEAAIAGLSVTELDLALSKDSWTIRQIVHHLADGDDLWKAFVKQAIGNPGSEFVLAWYWQMPQNEWAERWAYRERAIEPSQALYRASRFHIVQLLEHTPEVWDKSLRIRGPHGDEQDVSVRWVVEMQTRHIEDHLNEIREIRQAHRI